MYDDIGRVSADLMINSDELSPAQITELLGIEPDYSHAKGAPIADGQAKQNDRNP